MNLTPVQARIVGCLVEKEMATPDNYPLTMNGLLAACNQTSNRNPVTRLEEPTVSNALENLRALGVVRIVYSRSNRADKFRHVLDEMAGLEPEHMALLAVLLLRGPQTASELRTRTERLHPFEDADEVEETLRHLGGRAEPLVARLERQPGQKENRWAHLLGGDLADVMAADDGDRRDGRDGRDGASGGQVPSRSDRLAALEEQVADIRADLERLQASHHDLVGRLGEPDG